MGKLNLHNGTCYESLEEATTVAAELQASLVENYKKACN